MTSGENTEFYNEGGKYEITVNPMNTVQHLFYKRGGSNILACEEERIEKVFKVINPWLKEYLGKYGNYNLQWEIAEITSMKGMKGATIEEGYPRIHLHGYYTINDPIGWLMVGMPNIARIVGNVQLNKSDIWQDKTVPGYKKGLKREDYWRWYISKQEKLMRRYCLNHDIPYILSNLTPTSKTYNTNDKRNIVTKYYTIEQTDSEDD